MEKKFITLKHLMIDNRKCIGLQFYTDKVLQALVNDLPGIQWSEEFRMNYVFNSYHSLDLIFKKFKGVAWVNCNYFMPGKSFGRENEPIDVAWFRKRKHKPGYIPCPESFLTKLELKCYANNTVKKLMPTTYKNNA